MTAIVNRATNAKPYELARVPDSVTSDRDLAIGVTYRTDPDALAHLLPPGFVPSDPVVQFRFRRSEGLTWIDGGNDSSMGISIPVVYENSEPAAEGVYWPALWEDDFLASALGIWIMGVSKRFGDIDAGLDVNGLSHTMLSVHGRPLIEIEFEHGDELTGDALDDLRARTSTSTCLGFKQVPSVDQRNVDLTQVTSYPVEVDIRRAWSGKGEVRVHEVDPRVLGHEYPAMAAIQDLPLLENVGAVYVESSYAIHLAQGRVIDSH